MNCFLRLRQKITEGNARSVAVKKNIVGSIVIKGVSIIVSFLLVPATIGYVNAELYGVWLTLASIMSWVHFADVGFTQGLKNRLAEAIAVEDWEKGRCLVSTTYFMMVLIFLPLCLILEVIIPHVDWVNLLNVNSQYTKDIILTMQVIIAFACIQMFVNTIVSVVAAFQEVALSSLFSVVGNFLSLIAIYILRAFCPASLPLLGFVFALLPIVVTVIASIFLYLGKYKKVAPSLNHVKFNHIKDLFGLGYKFFIINIQVLIIYQSTNFIISYVSSPVEVANYNIAYRLFNSAMMFFTIVAAPLWPAYTDAYTRGDYNWMKAVLAKMRKVLLWSILIIFIVLFLSPYIYKIWVGGTVTIPFLMSSLVSLYVIMFCWQSLNGTLIAGMGKITLSMYLEIVGMVSHIPLSLFLGRYMGGYGVIVSMIIITSVYAVYFHIQVKKLLDQTAEGIWNK